MRYEYLATEPTIPVERKSSMRNSPMMDNEEMTHWLNDMACSDWELITHGSKAWLGGHVQHWWVFRRPMPE